MSYLLALVFVAMLSHYYELPKSLYHKSNVKVSFATHHRAREWVKSTEQIFIAVDLISPSELRATLKKSVPILPCFVVC